MGGLDIVVFIGIGAVAALVAFMVARDKAGALVVLIAAVSGIVVALLVSVIGTMALNRALELSLNQALQLGRLHLPATVIGSAVGIWWARQYRRGL